MDSSIISAKQNQLFKEKIAKMLVTENYDLTGYSLGVAKQRDRINTNSAMNLFMNNISPHCHHLHIMTECNKNFIKKTVLICVKLLKINMSVNLIPLLLFKREQLRRDTKKELVKVLKSITRSVLFLYTFVVFCYVNICYIKPILKYNHNTGQIVSILVSSFSIAFEYPHKRQLINSFLMPKVIEALGNIIHKRGIPVNDIPHLQHLVFATSIGIISVVFN